MLNTNLKPMLLEKMDNPFNNKDYIYECKFDGVRCLLHLDETKVRLLSRHSTDCTQSFPELHSLYNYLNVNNVILDGELVVFSDNKPAFDLTMKRFMGSSKRTDLLKKYPVKFIVWDVLYLNGKPLLKEPLIRRKEILKEMMTPNNIAFLIDYIEEYGEEFFQQVCSLDLEGIVAKKKDSNYLLDKRSENWVKIKNYRETECVILGIKLDKPGLFLGEKEEETIKFRGTCELGVDSDSFKALWGISKDITVKRKSNSVWLEPILNCKVKHIGTDSLGRLREANFKKFIV